MSQLTGVSSAMPMGANGMHAYPCTGCSAKGNMQLAALAKKPVKPTETTPGVAQCRCCMEALHCSAALQCGTVFTLSPGAVVRLSMSTGPLGTSTSKRCTFDRQVSDSEASKIK